MQLYVVLLFDFSKGYICLYLKTEVLCMKDFFLGGKGRESPVCNDLCCSGFKDF